MGLRRRPQNAIILSISILACTLVYLNLYAHDSRGSAGDQRPTHWQVNVIVGNPDHKRQKTKPDALEKCNIPTLEVNASEIIEFYQRPAPLDCAADKPPPWLRIQPNGSLQLTEYAKQKSKVRCNLHFYHRVDDHQVKWTIEENYRPGSVVHGGDFLHAKCSAGDDRWFGPHQCSAMT